MKKDLGWLFRSFFILAVGGSVLATLIGGVVFWQFSRDLPKIISVDDYRPLGVTQVIASGTPTMLAAHGPTAAPTVIGEFYKERRYVIPYEKIPQLVVNAFVSAEDDTFFQHQGINLVSMLRAGIANARAGHVVQGGSTITQQVAKSLLLTPEKSFSRKFKEVILAYKIERNLTKQQILYLYLNQIYLGHGAYGVQAASQTYFRKDVSKISLAEASILAGMPQAPGKYSPHLNPRKAKDRQLYVLRRMYENKFISQSQMAEAAAAPVRIFHDEDLNLKYAPYLVEHVRRYLVEKYGDKAVYQDAMTIKVPTSADLSKVAMQSVREGLRAVDKRQGYRGPIQHLKAADEVDKFLREERMALIERRVQYRLFLPDGRMDSQEAMKEAGISSDQQLLAEDEIYRAVVASVDDKRKVASTLVGSAKLELSIEKMKWARPSRDGKAIGPEPTIPSRVLSKGDVIWVRTLKGPSGGLVAALEQEPKVQGALVSVDVRTGGVLAMVGGYDYEQSEFNRVTQAQRQPGSAFKPIIYAAGIEKGYTPASVILDAPLTLDAGDSSKWKPNNFEEKFYGDTTFRQALIKSRNVPTIRILQEVQIPFLIDYSRRLGMNSNFPPDLSIALGSATLSPLELAKVYALFPRLGKRLNPIFIQEIADRDGKVLEERKLEALIPMLTPPAPAPVANSEEATPPSSRPVSVGATSGSSVQLPQYPLPGDPDQLMDPRVAYVMTHLMKEVVNYGTGYEAKSLGRAAAGKTGTTSDYLDAWFMGFTPDVVTAAWVGFDNQQPIGPGETGAKAALPIWLSFMKEAVKQYPDSDFQIPSGVVFASIDSATGKPADPNSSKSIKEAFIEGTQPIARGGSGAVNAPTENTNDFLKEDFE